MITEKGPDTTSSDYDAMAPYWRKSAALIGGTDAMRAGGQEFLPKFIKEPEADYDFRLKNAKYTNIFGDIVDTLASKPFEQEIVVEGAGGDIDQYIEDIDGQGNHLHVFASNVFHAGVADGLTWVMVDYPASADPKATRAQEKASGVRPYWVHIKASDMLAVYSEKINGKDELVHVRIRENIKIREGFEEVIKERVRVIDRPLVIANEADLTVVGADDPIWTLWEKQKDKNGKESWVAVGGGSYTIGYIPIYPFIAGMRQGSSWVVKPPLESAADLQIEHYQQESELKHIRQMTAFPMLAANGVEPSRDENGTPLAVPVGPYAVLFAPPGQDGSNGNWTTLEPAGSSLTFCSNEIDKTEAQLRELGRQPLTAQSGNITTITAAFAGDKAMTVIEAMALNFKDTCENCLKTTAKWIDQDIEPEVQINTDFGYTLAGDSGVDAIKHARDIGDISQETYLSELKRRDILSPNFDMDEERDRINDELPDDPDANEFNAANDTGNLDENEDEDN